MKRGTPSFAPLPVEKAFLHWPTPNQQLFSRPEAFLARTEANPDYGKPGWTRDAGRRLHRGCDIAPVERIPTGQTTTVEFTDLETGEEYPSEQPTWVPRDPVFAVADGVVEEALADQDASTFGCHLLLQHRWPACGEVFFTLYAHLRLIDVRAGEAVEGGQRIGTMGTTSSSSDARNWMAIAPHLHFEARNQDREPYDPLAFLERFLVQ